MELNHVQLELCDFTITNLSQKDGPKARSLMQAAFEEALGDGAHYGGVEHCGPPLEASAYTLNRGRRRIQLRAHLTPKEYTYRTYFLDALAVYPFSGFFPLTPAWGRASVSAKANLHGLDAPIPPIELEVSAPFSMVFYSWYRTAPVEEAYRRSYQTLFQELSERIAQHIKLGTGGSGAVSQGPKEIRLRGEGARIITEAPIDNAENAPLWWRYLSAAGGLELSKTGGWASVRSRARSVLGVTETVGSGRATASGYRIALFKPPTKTGFFFPPRLGFFSQEITISGFRQALPQFQAEGATEIAAIASDPNSGLPVDANAPIAYDLKLRSGYVGQSAGFNLVFGSDSLRLFSSMQLGLNLFEVRHSRVRIAQSETQGFSTALLQSGQFAAQIGLEIPSWHVAIRSAFEFEWFRAFDYPDPVEFQGSVAFNPQKNVFERQRVFVDGASLYTFNWQLSALYVF